MAVPPPPLALPAVDFDEPDIHNALRNVEIYVVDDDNILRRERAYIMRDSTSQPPTRAYQKFPKPSLPLNGKGEILYGQVLLRDPRSSPQVVFVKSEETVVIKKLRKRHFDPFIQAYLDGTGPVFNDNPYNEISVMQQYGNDENIIRCHEALQDELHLYIVMPYRHEGDLHSHVQHGLGGGLTGGLSAIQDTMVKLIRNARYLQSHGLVHRDLKPENTIFEGPFIDFSMTLQQALMETFRQDVLSQGPAGSPSYISPEVFHSHNFNNKADVWALGCISWNLLTGIRLYHIPTDDSYNFMILAGGLTNQEWCDGALEHLRSTNPNHDLIPRLEAIQVLPNVARDLLSRLLQPNPNDRPTLEEILQHPFFQQLPP